MMLKDRSNAPAHPGALLPEDVLPALRVTVTDAARQLGVSRQALYAILAERAGISAEMAVRLGKFCGNGPALWLRLAGRHAGRAQVLAVRLSGLMLAAASGWALVHGLATAMGSDFCLPF